MKKAILAMAAAALVATLVPGNFAAEKHYIITNDDNIPRNSNTATVFEVNTETGSLKQVLVLKTGGTGLGGGYSATPGMQSMLARNACSCPMQPVATLQRSRRPVFAR